MLVAAKQHLIALQAPKIVSEDWGGMVFWFVKQTKIMLGLLSSTLIVLQAPKIRLWDWGRCFLFVEPNKNHVSAC